MMPDHVAYYLTQDLNPPLSPAVIRSEAESRLVEPWRESEGGSKLELCLGAKSTALA